VIQPRELLLLVLGLSATAGAEDSLTIAVASNFRSTAHLIADAFTSELGVSVRLSSGSTGKLYAQIVNGAPYDVFLAAENVFDKHYVSNVTTNANQQLENAAAFTPGQGAAVFAGITARF